MALMSAACICSGELDHLPVSSSITMRTTASRWEIGGEKPRSIALTNDCKPGGNFGSQITGFGRLQPHGWRSAANSPFRPVSDTRERQLLNRSHDSSCALKRL